MNYDDWKTRTPEEDRAVFRRLHHIRRDPEDGPPPDEDDEPDDPDATEILTDPEDPGEHLEPHKPDLGGES